MLLGAAVHDRPVDLDATIATDLRARGAVAGRAADGAFQRAETIHDTALVLRARPYDGGVEVAVLGPASTPAHTVETGLAAAARWAGLTDDPTGFADVVAGHPRLRRLHGLVGDPLLSALPRVDEALGRAVIAQLVQTAEARRSIVQLTARVGLPAATGLWCWPDPARLRATQDWTFRGCGLSLRAARALRAAAIHVRRLEEARGDWTLLDRRIRALPGCGVWTSGKTRLLLGDPDAVPVGDYNLPGLVGAALAGEPVDDAGMAELLAPFAGQRGRVLRLLTVAARAGALRLPVRRAPRAALSAHRYW